MANTKQTIITFKADDALADILKSIPNRSAFIRSAVLAALDHLCPICRGTGILTPSQKQHWDSFAETHALRECGECHAWHLVCEHDKPHESADASREHS